MDHGEIFCIVRGMHAVSSSGILVLKKIGG
jgi:hypothetical protein